VHGLSPALPVRRADALDEVNHAALEIPVAVGVVRSTGVG